VIFVINAAFSDAAAGRVIKPGVQHVAHGPRVEYPMLYGLVIFQASSIIRVQFFLYIKE
jgi:hypothetical protein